MAWARAMANPIRFLDRLLRRAYGIYEFWSAPDCIFRVSVSEADRRIELPGLTLEKGARLVELHFWNEHMPRLPEGGPTVSWAKQLLRQVDRSFREVAKRAASDARLAGAQAIGGVMIAFEDEAGFGAVAVLERLGFRVAPYRNPHGELAEFWSRLYSWVLLRAYQRHSLRGRRVSQLHRVDLWMPMADFMSRYGARASGEEIEGRPATSS